MKEFSDVSNASIVDQSMPSALLVVVVVVDVFDVIVVIGKRHAVMVECWVNLGWQGTNVESIVLVSWPSQ